MRDDHIKIKFQNSQNPTADFDVLSLDDLHQRQDLDHSPYHLHRVNFYLMIFIEEGSGMHTIDFTDYSLTSGSILTIRKDQIHKFHSNTTLKGQIFLFTDEFLVSYLEELESLKSLQLFNEQLGAPLIQIKTQKMPEFQGLIDRIRKEYFNLNDSFSQGIIRSELHILISKLYRLKSNQNSFVHHRKYLNLFINFQNLVEANATQFNKVNRYARMMGVSPKTLNNITRSIIDKTAKEFIDDICTKQIKRLLINTELSVKEIAFACGFDEITNFYKYFKRLTGITPEKFRSPN